MNLQLEIKHWKIIRGILKKYPYKFYAYGSRVKGMAYKYSDLDLCYREEIPLGVISRIEEEFEESNLPWKVELVNWRHMRPKFREMIRGDLILLEYVP